MRRRTRAGRRPKPPTTTLGIQIAERLAAADIPMAEFARRLGVSRVTAWRVLHGRVGFARRISLLDICRALDMDLDTHAAEMAAFLTSCSGDSPNGAAAPAQQGAGERPRTPTDYADTAAHRLRAFLLERIQHARLSLSAIARTLNVQPSTVTRLLLGQIQRTHAFTAEQLASALDLDERDRRTFLRLALEAGLFALRPAPAQAAALTRFRPLERSVGATLDQIEREVIALRAERNRGEVEPVLRRAQQLFIQLFDYPSASSALSQSRELARTKLRVAFEYCEAQAAALPWYQRGAQMIATLDRMQADVLQRFPPKQFASEYGHLLNLRAPLYREAGDPAHRASGYQESIGQLTWALERILPYADEPSLHVELLRNRGHLYLMRGDTQHWRTDLAAAEQIAERMRGSEGDAFRGLVTYSWGEGYQHLASAPRVSASERRRYLSAALDALTTGHVVFQRCDWEGYDLLAQIAEVHCIAWEDKAEALARARRLRATAERAYPALAPKLDRAITQYSAPHTAPHTTR